MSLISKIRSGGQSGADRGALEAARSYGIPICGWCPRDGWAEDLPDAPGLLTIYPELQETSTSDVNIRTELNVRDSDATIIIADEITFSPGTNKTYEFAKKYNKPVLMTHDKSPEVILSWLKNIGTNLDLNVAGPRQSEDENAFKKSKQLVSELLKINSL